MGWRSTFRQYFTFNKRERKGVVTLLLLIFVVLLARMATPLFLEPDPIDQEALQEKMMDLEAQIQKQKVAVVKDHSTKSDSQKIDRFMPFDPNTISQSGLETMGLPSWLAERILKFRERVRPFQKPDDMLQVYGMDTAWLERVKPFISIDKQREDFESTSFSESADSSKRKRSAKKPAIPIRELNGLDTNELQEIPGIGSYFARSIVEQRDRLGGFRSFEQLLTIYMMRESALDALATYTYIDTNAIERIDLNRTDLQALGIHPYLSWSQAKAIINYRKQHGNYQSVAEIRLTDVIPDSVYLKIAPYLIVK